jgi:hypothetical protein
LAKSKLYLEQILALNKRTRWVLKEIIPEVVEESSTLDFALYPISTKCRSLFLNLKKN